MSAHLHWRVHVTANNGGGNLGISELEFRATPGGADQASGGTVTQSGGSGASAFDGNLDTQWNAGAAPSVGTPQWVAYEFTSAVEVQQVLLTAGTDKASSPTDYTIDFSDDGSAWTTLITVVGDTDWPTARVQKILNDPGIPADTNPGHRFWRLNVTAGNSSSLYVGEVQLRTTIGGTDEATYGAAKATDGIDNRFVGKDAFLDNPGDFWFSNASLPQSLEYDFGQNVDIYELAVQAATGSQAFAPRDFTLDWSDDGSSWTSLITATNETGWASDEIRLFQAPVPPAVGQLSQLWHLLVRSTSELTTPYGDLITAGMVSQSYSIRTSSETYQRYGNVPIASALVQPYESRVFSGISQPYDIPLAVGLFQPYGLRVARGISQFYGSPLAVGLFQPYTDRVSLALSQEYSTLEPVVVSLDSLYGNSVPLAVSHEHNYDLLLLAEVVRTDTHLWDMVSASNVILLPETYAEIDGVRVELGDVNISYTEGSSIWTSRMEVVSLSDYNLFGIDKAFTLNFFGEVFSLVVKGVTNDRQTAGRMSMSVSGASPVSLLNDSNTPKITSVYGAPILASTAVGELLGGPVTWNVTDWLIPANRLAFSNVTPLAAASLISRAVGGVIESLPDGSLEVNPLFPVSVPEWDTGAIDHQYNEEEHIYSSSLRPRIRGRGNLVTVSDFADTKEGSLSVMVDSRETGLNLGNTSLRAGSSIAVLLFGATKGAKVVPSVSVGTIYQGAPQVFTEEVTLAFTNSNQATLPREADSIVSYEWVGTSLGTLLLQTDKRTVLSSSIGVAVARVTYEVEALSFVIGAPNQVNSDYEYPLVSFFEEDQ